MDRMLPEEAPIKIQLFLIKICMSLWIPYEFLNINVKIDFTKITNN